MNRVLISKRTLVAGRALIWLPISLLSVLGCSTIIGLDDYTVAKQGTGGQSGTGGRSGTGGAGASAGSTGNGEAGAAGGGELGAATGAGGVGAPQAALGCDGQSTFAPEADLIRSCILRAGCTPNIDPVRTISTCVSLNTQAALPGETCNLTSQTCAGYEACEHTGIAHADLCGGTKKTRCDNDVAINCGNYNVDQFFDCAGLGGTCGTYTYAPTGEVFADCKLAVTAGACTGVTDITASFCQSGSNGTPDARYYCYGGQAYGQSCGQYASCFDTTGADADSTPDATCFFNFAETCIGQPDSAMCSKGVATTCAGEAVIHYDCGSSGLACASAGPNPYCVAPGCTKATVDACSESCDGTKLTFCYGGAPYSVDCTDYGFTSCLEGTMTNSDSSTAPFAACR